MPVKVVPVTEQRLAPVVTAYVTAPVPEPPVVLSKLVWPKAIGKGDAEAVSVA